MPSAAEYRKEAAEFYRRARESADDAESLAYTLRGIELEMKADALERGQVQQDGTQPQPAPPQQPAAPAQQQQQVQPPKKDK